MTSVNGAGKLRGLLICRMLSIAMPTDTRTSAEAVTSAASASALPWPYGCFESGGRED
jgi:hypothetical protein